MMRASILRMTTTLLVLAISLMGCATQETEGQKTSADPSATTQAPVAQASVTTATAAATPGAKKSCDGKEECDAGCLYKDQYGKPLAAPKTVSAEEAACPHAEQAPGNAQVAKGKDHFGAAFTLNASQPLSKVLVKANDSPSDVMQVTGTIDAVCQKKGCWMVIKDGEATARVLMKNHSFAIPIGVKGKEATVEGALKVRTFSEAQVKHLEEDRGGDPSKVSGTRREYVLTASGVRISS